MKTYSLIKKTLVIIIASIILACGAETIAALVFIPAFAATWPDANDSEHRISLQPEGENLGVESGIFDGDEQHDSDNTRDGNKLEGSFNGLNIEFTIERLSNNDQDTTYVQFTGTMIPSSDEDHTITRINLNSSQETLILGSE